MIAKAYTKAKADEIISHLDIIAISQDKYHLAHNDYINDALLIINKPTFKKLNNNLFKKIMSKGLCGITGKLIENINGKIICKICEQRANSLYNSLTNLNKNYKSKMGYFTPIHWDRYERKFKPDHNHKCHICGKLYASVGCANHYHFEFEYGYSNIEVTKFVELHNYCDKNNCIWIRNYHKEKEINEDGIITFVSGGDCGWYKPSDVCFDSTCNEVFKFLINKRRPKYWYDFDEDQRIIWIETKYLEKLINDRRIK